MYGKWTYHAQCDGVGSGSRLAFEEQLGCGDAHDNVDQDDLENVYFELELVVKEGHDMRPYVNFSAVSD